MGNLIDTAVTNQITGKYYFFRGNQYVRYDGGIGVEPGYPKNVGGSEDNEVDGWKNLWEKFPGPYDAACHRATSTSEYFFFKDNQYVLYNSVTGVISVPKPILGNWNNLYEKLSPPYDAVVVGTENGKYYFFKGHQFVRYVGGSGVDLGPQDIDTGWYNLYSDFPGPYDAVVASTRVDGDYYFFRAGRYAKYKRSTGVYDDYKNIDKNGKSTRYMWSGVWRLGDYLGPILGPSSAGEDPKIWVWTRKDFNLTLKNAPTGITIVKKSPSQTLPDLPGSYAQEWSVRGLAAGDLKQLTFRMDVNEVNYQPTWYEWPLLISKAPDGTTASNLTIAFGSCVDDVRQESRFASIPSLEKIKTLIPSLDLIPSLEKIKTLNRHLIILGGDTTYYVGPDKKSTKPEDVKLGDMQDKLHMVLRQATTRSHPSVVSLLQKAPVFSTWDDHDFGFNDATGNNINTETTITKQQTTNIFKYFWANTYRSLMPNHTNYPYPIDTIEQRYRWGQVEIWIPDCRTHRKPGQVLGNLQTERLIIGMRESDALVKILVLSSQLIPNRKNAEGEKSAGFIHTSPMERNAILEALVGRPAVEGRELLPAIEGKILILSGDVHFHELTSIPKRTTGGSIHELTASPFLVKDEDFFNTPYPPKATEPYPDTTDGYPGTRLWSYSGEGFALIKISFTTYGPAVTLESYVMNKTNNEYDPRVNNINIANNSPFTF